MGQPIFFSQSQWRCTPQHPTTFFSQSEWRRPQLLLRFLLLPILSFGLLIPLFKLL